MSPRTVSGTCATDEDIGPGRTLRDDDEYHMYQVFCLMADYAAYISSPYFSELKRPGTWLSSAVVLVSPRPHQYFCTVLPFDFKINMASSHSLITSINQS